MNEPYRPTGHKRSRSRSPPPWRRPYKTSRTSDAPTRGDYQPAGGRGRGDGPPRPDQARLNQLQEDERMREWVAQEDNFVLKQAKKKAQIRVKEGRAKPIDWLAVTLHVIDPTRNPLDDEVDESGLDLIDPDGVFEGLPESQLFELEKDIDTFLKLETNAKNRDYWRTMKILCTDQRKQSEALGPEGRAVSSVSSDIDRLLSPKTFEELEVLEAQINLKLDSNEPIDTDYWEQLLKNLLVWKARAKLKKVYQSVMESRLSTLRNDNLKEAENGRSRLQPLLQDGKLGHQSGTSLTSGYRKSWDPEPLLQLRPEDKSHEIVDEGALLDRIVAERRRVSKMGYVPTKQTKNDKSALVTEKRSTGDQPSSTLTRFAAVPAEDFSQATKALYEREVARGIGEDEEIFAGEEEVDTKSKTLWSGKYRPRKPRYFNRVQMGYEWNKYNQTHYDHDNPPPKVVQGYKFNIFYPDLIDKTKAPTYKIEREGGRKKGQSFAPAGEEDTCVIRFISGPPYEDVAFRIVDKEWDYSAKRDRGFKSSFDKGILQLSFQFKKIYYRK
jgi:hypothetical protein